MAIVPITDDEEHTKSMIEFFSDTAEGRGNLAIRFRTLFDCVLVLIGDFDEDR